MTDQARGAVIEIIEKRREPLSDSQSDSVVFPNEVRINGEPLLVPEDKPVIVHEITTRADDIVSVTLTLMARIVSIRAEEPTDET